MQTPSQFGDVRADIPPGLVWRHSYEAFTAEMDDPYHAVTRLEGLPPVVWATDVGLGRSGWLVTHHDVIAEVFRDTDNFTTERPVGVSALLGMELKLNPVDYDPPAHHGYRVILQPLFTPAAIRRLGASVRESCEALIAKFETKGGCEFIHDFAVPFPSYIFLDLMGMPRSMLPSFLEWENGVVMSGDIHDRRKAARAIYDYLETFLEEQRSRPSSEIVSTILAAEYEGRPLNHPELMGMLYVLYLAGLDTVASTLGWVMRHLATHPDLQARLRAHPRSIPAAVDEFLRAFPVAHTYRMVTRDLDFHGAPLRKDDEIHLPTPLAGRDSRIYADPHRIDIDRNARHLGFGTGPHICLGAHLARREIGIVVEEFLKRFENIRIAEGERYRYHTYINFAVDYLPLRWDPAKP
jgi:cytochrome P450